MKKTLIIIFILIVLSLPVYSYEPPKVSEYYPEELYDYLPDAVKENIDSADASSLIDIPSFISIISEMLLKLIYPIMKNFLLILGIIILSAVFSTLKNTLTPESGSKVYEYICTICIGLILYSILNGLWTQLSDILSKLNLFMNTMTPVMTAIYALGGNVTTAAVNNSGMMIVLTVFEDICYYGLRPVLQICFGLSFVSCVCDNLNLNSIAKFVRDTFTLVLTFLMTLLTAILSFQTSLSQSADSVAIRTVKFASGSFIPVVGSAVSEATSTIASGVSFIKNSVGILAVIGIVLLIMPMFLSLCLNKFSVSFGSSIAEIFGLEKERAFLKGIGELINFAIAICAASSMMFIINLALFIKSSVALGI